MIIRSFDTSAEPLIVAEIGNNHEGSFDLAKELVRRAAEAGAHAVKFQTFKTELFVSPVDKERYARLSSFELSFPQFEALQQLAKSLGLLFLSTALDIESAKFLRGLVDCYKVASSDNRFYPLIDYLCATGLPIIVSSGLSDLNEIKETKEFICKRWPAGAAASNLGVLHCVSSYPCIPEEANLRAIPLLASELKCTVGYSDHTIGPDACLAAIALGADIIEKHFTLDNHYSSFRDHQLSADPAEFAQLVGRSRGVRKLLGKAEKVVQPSEAAISNLLRRSIVAAKDLAKGHTVQLEDLMWTRPYVGLPPGCESQIVGKVLRRPIAFATPIQTSDIDA